MNIDEAIKQLKEILNTKDIIDKIKDNEEREIEYSAYFEDMPFEAIETVLKENFEMKTKLEKIQMLNLYIGSQDYDNEDNVIIEYAPFCLEDLEESN